MRIDANSSFRIYPFTSKCTSGIIHSQICDERSSKRTSCALCCSLLLFLQEDESEMNDLIKTFVVVLLLAQDQPELYIAR